MAHCALAVGWRRGSGHAGYRRELRPEVANNKLQRFLHIIPMGERTERPDSLGAQ